VRGSRRLQVAGLLTLSAASSGALLGLTVGAAWASLQVSRVGLREALWISVVALSADFSRYSLGHPRPLSRRTQVPMQWARLFDLRTAATLYGARLGIGPLTPMPSWTWWAAAVIGASAGAWESAFVGAGFGAVRMAIVIGAGLGVEPAMARRMALLRRSERVVVPAIFLVVPFGWLVLLRLFGSSI
jgi:hypothetical protein